MQPKLPNIEVSRFNGNIRDFVEFKNLLENLIHTNEAITNVQKLYYLKRFLSNKAAELIKDFSMIKAAYSEAWKALCERYDNKRQIIRTYLSDLFALQKLKSEIGMRKNCSIKWAEF